MPKKKRAAKRAAPKKRRTTVKPAASGSAADRLDADRRRAAAGLRVGARVRVTAGPDIGSIGTVEKLTGGYAVVNLGGVAGCATFDAYKLAPAE